MERHIKEIIVFIVAFSVLATIAVALRPKYQALQEKHIEIYSGNKDHIKVSRVIGEELLPRPPKRVMDMELYDSGYIDPGHINFKNKTVNKYAILFKERKSKYGTLFAHITKKKNGIEVIVPSEMYSDPDERSYYVK